MRRDRRPHAIAWWLWGIGMAVAALRTSNPVLLLGISTVAIAVGVGCRSAAPWGRSVGVFVRLGLIVIILRVLLQIIFGQRLPGQVLFTLPSIPLPGWAAGVSIGGPVTAQSLLAALVGGMRLAAVLVAFGAVNSVASPRELLRSLPGLLNEVAVAVTVGLCFVPEVMGAMTRIRKARRLRGRPTTGVAGWRGTAVPVLEDALERSTQLAASMGARGFGRAGPPRSTRARLIGRVLALLGVLAILLGGYGVLGGGGAVPVPALITVLGGAALAAGVTLGPRSAVRTRYRPTPFGARSIACVLAGASPAVTFALSPASSIAWSPYPLSWPAIAPIALVGIAAAAAPLVLRAVPERPTVPDRSRREVAV